MIVAYLDSYTGFHALLAAWRSGNGVGRINEVTLRRVRLVLGWVTCTGSTPGGGTLFPVSYTHLTLPTIYSV